MLADIPGWKRGERGLGMPPAARHACSSVRSRQDLPAHARSAHPEGLTVTGRRNACGVSGLRERPPAEREPGGGFRWATLAGPCRLVSRWLWLTAGLSPGRVSVLEEKVSCWRRLLKPPERSDTPHGHTAADGGPHAASGSPPLWPLGLLTIRAHHWAPPTGLPEAAGLCVKTSLLALPASPIHPFSPRRPPRFPVFLA